MVLDSRLCDVSRPTCCAARTTAAHHGRRRAQPRHSIESCVALRVIWHYSHCRARATFCATEKSHPGRLKVAFSYVFVLNDAALRDTDCVGAVFAKCDISGVALHGSEQSAKSSVKSEPHYMALAKPRRYFFVTRSIVEVESRVRVLITYIKP